MPVERRQRRTAQDELSHAREAGGERRQLRLNLEHHTGAGLRHQRHVAQELEGVAEPLLGMQQDRLPGNRLAAPERRRGNAA